MRRRDARLVPIAEFSTRDLADEAWIALDSVDVAASVVGEPAGFGVPAVFRVYVAKLDVERAQETIAPIVNRR